MELLELVREIENAPDPTATARIERSRATVLASIAAPRKTRSHARWVWGGTAAGTVTAGAIIATVVIAGTVSPLVAEPASAAAVAVLNRAADLVISEVDPAVGPGQYLRVRETYEVISLWDADTDLSDPIAGFNTSTLTSSEGAVHAQGIRDLYVPSDRSGDWILDDRYSNEVLNVFGDQRALPAYERLVEAVPESDADPGGIETLPSGLQSWDPSTTDDDQYYDPFRKDYGDMPRDPQQLLDWYRQHVGSTDDWYLFQVIGRYLSTDVMPADLRAASLRALGFLSGVDVAGTVGSVATLHMPATLDEGNEFGDLLVSELDIDTSTGRIVGSRETYPHRSTDLLPAGMPWASWKIEVTVVDEAPHP